MTSFLIDYCPFILISYGSLTSGMVYRFLGVVILLLLMTIGLFWTETKKYVNRTHLFFILVLSLSIQFVTNLFLTVNLTLFSGP